MKSPKVFNTEDKGHPISFENKHMLSRRWMAGWLVSELPDYYWQRSGCLDLVSLASWRNDRVLHRLPFACLLARLLSARLYTYATLPFRLAPSRKGNRPHIRRKLCPTQPARRQKADFCTNQTRLQNPAETRLRAALRVASRARLVFLLLLSNDPKLIYEKNDFAF